MKRLVTMAYLADVAGVGRGTISALAKGRLAPAYDGSRMDLNHPAITLYLSDRAAIARGEEPVIPKGKNGGAAVVEAKRIASMEAIASGNVASGADKPALDEFMNMTLAQILMHYGTEIAFADWLRATKTIEEIEEKRLKNAEKRGELVSRDLVKRGIIDTINETFLRMLTDGAKTMASSIVACHLAGGDRAEVEKMVAEQFAKFIKPCKAKMERVIKNV